MSAPPPLLPFEFTVTGRAYSHQSHNRAGLAAWRQKVTTAAAATWTAAPLAGFPLQIVVTYYHERDAVRIDGDNLLKPIQDALIGLVYEDDRLIVDSMTRKTGIDWAFKVRHMSRVLLEAFHAGEPFVHVIIDRAPDHRTLPRERS